MLDPIVPYVSFMLGGLVFLALAWLVLRPRLASMRREAKIEAEEWKAEARRSFEKEKEAEESELRRRGAELDEREGALSAREKAVHEERELLELQREDTHRLEAEAEKDRAESNKLTRLYRLKLHHLTQVDREEARKELFEDVKRESEVELQEYKSELLREGESEVRGHAQRILLAAMQRIASNPANETSATIVTLPNEELKGRIIGREGRNIRSFELATGTTLMIDETPGQVLVSSFDPVRREIARLTLESLIEDGRINPMTIEETVRDTEENMQRSVMEFGEKAVRQLRLKQVHPEIIGLLGRLHYRLSNNQNTLEHSIEVAFVCSLLASELGLDADLAKRAGLFHDMGKSVSHEYEGSHAKVGADILRRHNEDWRVANAVHAHHEEVPAESPYAPLVMVADSLSAMRPGARTDSMDSYVQRVQSLEDLAKGFDGVQDAYAVQAGREIRVIVAPGEVDDLRARQLARTIRQRIEDEMSYPNPVKVTVIRERRFSETAK